MADTADRSLVHWSEDKRAGMEAFYALATDDYRHLALAQDWRAWFEDRQAEVGDRPLRLLDVACGSGKFPTALLRHGQMDKATIRPVDYALLDPSAFSLAEARGALAPPFVPGAAYETTLQDLDVPDRAFDILWATHALYAIPAAELDRALARFLAALGGRGFIAHAMAASHYITFYDHFLAAFRGGAGEAYRSGEEVLASLERLGAKVEHRVIAYDSTAPGAQASVVEGFLQRCAFDDTVSLAQMQADPITGPYLDRCLVEGVWRFPQQVGLFTITA